jgi:hypothetical protein
VLGIFRRNLKNPFRRHCEESSMKQSPDFEIERDSYKRQPENLTAKTFPNRASFLGGRGKEMTLKGFFSYPFHFRVHSLVGSLRRTVTRSLIGQSY